MDNKKKPALRSQAWFGARDSESSMRGSWMHRSWMKNQGYPDDLFDGRPVIGICNTWSELTPCNGHFRELAEWVKRGVYEAGGFPLEFPVMSLGETLLRPTAMLFRNLASMYEQMGESTNAAKYLALAKSVSAPSAKPAGTDRPGASATAGTSFR